MVKLDATDTPRNNEIRETFVNSFVTLVFKYGFFNHKGYERN
jgi:hypothetical protein